MKSTAASTDTPASSRHREEILAAIRSEVEKTGGGGRLRMKRFLSKAKIGKSRIRRLFGSWSNAVAAAGFNWHQQRSHVEADELLKDWGTVMRKLKCLPTYTAYNEHGKYSPSTFQLRFGSWNNIGRAFRAFGQGKTEWADVLEYCPPPPPLRRRGSGQGQNHIPRRMRQRNMPGRPKEDRPIFGEPIDDVPGLLNAPMNENGVVMLFGLMADRLGFHVRAIRGAFPDCLAMRWVGAASWQEVRIEFEFESKNFRDHKHPPSGCDILVCWVHNWVDCPPNLEVIALSEELERLREQADTVAPAGGISG